MFRLKAFFVATLLVLASLPMMAATYAVGTCKPKTPSFPTISAAVSTVPAGSIIQVCPGVYREQITISQPLNIQGATNETQDQILIAVPSTGLTTNVTSMFAEPVAAQVLVQATGVSISNLTVDGTGGGQACGTSNIWLAGIFYASGSSGTLNHVRASGQIDQGCGVGIWAENSATLSQSVTVLNSSVHDTDGAGIFAGSGSTPTLNMTIKDNYVSHNGVIGIAANSVGGLITGNIVTDAQEGIFALASSVSVTFNTVSNTADGISLFSSSTVQSNEVTNSAYGITVNGDGVTLGLNNIVLATTAAIEVNCYGATISRNTINDAAIGLDQVPPGFNGVNTFNNTGSTTTDACATTLVASAMRAKPRTAVISFRTPATPFAPQR